MQNPAPLYHLPLKPGRVWWKPWLAAIAGLFVVLSIVSLPILWFAFTGGCDPAFSALAKSPSLTQQVIGKDADASALLQKMETAYTAMHSYAVHVEYTRDDSSSRGIVYAPANFDLQFRRPNQLAIQEIGLVHHGNWKDPMRMQWDQYRTDGKVCMLSSTFGMAYAQFPLESDRNFFGLFSGSQLPMNELHWLGALLSGAGLRNWLRHVGYSEVSAGIVTTLKDIPVQTVIIRKSATGSLPPSELILTIGIYDYRLYQTQLIDHTASGKIITTINYSALQVNPVLANSLFNAPEGKERLASMDVLAVNVESIVLSNKEHKARVGDHVLLFQGYGFARFATGELVITKVKKYTCEADAINLNSIRPGHYGILVPRS